MLRCHQLSEHNVVSLNDSCHEIGLCRTIGGEVIEGSSIDQVAVLIDDVLLLDNISRFLPLVQCVLAV